MFFEDSAVRDLRVYADRLGGVVKQYRDNAGLECDAVVHLEDGIRLAYEDFFNNPMRAER